MQKVKKIISIVLLVITLLSMNLGCVNSSMFTEKQHLARISRRVNRKVLKMKYGTNDYGRPIEDYEVCDYEGFEIYPLYDENEELKYALIEFEPYGFAFVSIEESALIFNIGLSMYILNRVHEWYPYKELDDNGYPIYQYDKDGEIIYYKRSPYYVSNSINERKYLIKIYNRGYIPAIKEGEFFVNLVSGEIVDMEAVRLGYKQPQLSLSFFFKNKANNL